MKTYLLIKNLPYSVDETINQSSSFMQANNAAKRSES